MESKDGTWIMYGVSEDDPECLHTVDELIGYIEEVGFLPLFRNHKFVSLYIRSFIYATLFQYFMYNFTG